MIVTKIILFDFQRALIRGVGLREFSIRRVDGAKADQAGGDVEFDR